MTQEYEFFKDFAGVTKADLEMFKCGGGMKKVKKAATGTKTNKKDTIKKTSDNKVNPNFGRHEASYADGTKAYVDKSGQTWHGQGRDGNRFYTRPEFAGDKEYQQLDSLDRDMQKKKVQALSKKKK